MYPSISPIGGSEAAAAAFGAATALVTPAANVNGLVLRTAVLFGDTAQNLSLFVGTAAPANYQDTTKLCLFNCISGKPMTGEVRLPLRVPAGYGVYVIATAAAGGNYAAISYDLE